MAPPPPGQPQSIPTYQSCAREHSRSSIGLLFSVASRNVQCALTASVMPFDRRGFSEGLWCSTSRTTRTWSASSRSSALGRKRRTCPSGMRSYVVAAAVQACFVCLHDVVMVVVVLIDCVIEGTSVLSGRVVENTYYEIFRCKNKAAFLSRDENAWDDPRCYSLRLRQRYHVGAQNELPDRSKRTTTFVSSTPEISLLPRLSLTWRFFCFVVYVHQRQLGRRGRRVGQRGAVLPLRPQEKRPVAGFLRHAAGDGPVQPRGAAPAGARRRGPSQGLFVSSSSREPLTRARIVRRRIASRGVCVFVCFCRGPTLVSSGHINSHPQVICPFCGCWTPGCQPAVRLPLHTRAPPPCTRARSSFVAE